MNFARLRPTTTNENIASTASIKHESIFDINFNQAVTYDVFEMGDSFYLDINNLGDYSEELFKKMLETTDVKIEAIKISSDKTRFIIPAKELNFAYANVESNSKSIKLVFKDIFTRIFLHDKTGFDFIFISVIVSEIYFLRTS